MMVTSKVLMLRCFNTRRILSSWLLKQNKCFYMEDTKYGNDWNVVQTFSHRHLYDVPELETGELNATDAYQEEMPSTTSTVKDIDQLLDTYSRDDEEGTPVHASIVHDLLNDDNNYDEDSATDDDGQEDGALSENEHSSDDE